MRTIIQNEQEMENLADQLVDTVKDKLGKMAVVIALEGPLGAGKTVLTRQLAKLLGVVTVPTSPTFVIHIPHKLNGLDIELDHIDAWRLETVDELKEIGLQEMITNKHLIVIEWADKFREYIEALSKEAVLVWVSIDYGISDLERVVEWRVV